MQRQSVFYDLLQITAINGLISCKFDLFSGIENFIPPSDQKTFALLKFFYERG